MKSLFALLLLSTFLSCAGPEAQRAIASTQDFTPEEWYHYSKGAPKQHDWDRDGGMDSADPGQTGE